ncbi:hypothetical protein FOA43_000620 [Brettanomyces nanus]|uniref:DNA replication complex GINS protein PSF3 n=1 Tax=Eeniella nana TaxID=13502 RepID=A0A875RN82_EENNA|nr:uncharacterized protein FOA43_000620 [Brettanomyces nanus]QPG73310.1 hypothetical protein FOA43_000620 [Brettanomyces nanus]
MSYYDIDDILADSQRLPCKFNFSIPGLGYLNGRPGDPIKENDKVELPIWLANILAICAAQNGEDNDADNDEEENENSPDKQAFIRLIEPEFFSKQFLNFIKSDPLRISLAPYAYYYKIVTKWSYLFNDTELVGLISKMFVTRASEISALSYKSNDQFSGGNREFLNGLEISEKDLFKTSHISYKDMKNWMAGTK